MADKTMHYYAFAGVEVAVWLDGKEKLEQEGTLTPFRVTSVRKPYRFAFERVKTLDGPEGELAVHTPGLRLYRKDDQVLRYLGDVNENWQTGTMRIRRQGDSYDIQIGPAMKGSITGKTLLKAMETEHLLARAGSFGLHCSYIDLNGKAILFTAPSRTGKSTQAELWNIHRGAQIINGDRAAVCVTQDGIFAAGIPFAGSSSYCLNVTLPIRAIVYLSRGEEDAVRRLRGYEAFARVWEGISVQTWDMADMDQVSGSVQQVCERIPILHLTCKPGDSALEILEKALI